ncbi:MAG: pirin family protein [Kiritimatiellia bacterium]
MMSGAMPTRTTWATRKFSRPGDLQRMTAGTGIRHNERNPSPQARSHFIQIWLTPARKGLPPSYEYRHFPTSVLRNTLHPVAGFHPREGVLTLNVDASIRIGRLDENREISHVVAPGRNVWVQVTLGRLQINDQPMCQGDGAAVCQPEHLNIKAGSTAEVLLFDLPEQG